MDLTNRKEFRRAQRSITLLYVSTFFFVGSKYHLLSLVVVGALQFTFLLIYFKKELLALVPFGGCANLLTSFRWVLFFMAGIFAESWNIHLVGSVFLVGIVLDAFDGLIARKRGEVTQVGALLDIEADSLFMALICTVLYSEVIAFPGLLIAGYLRWVYLLFKWLAGWEHLQEGRQPHARWLAILSFIALFFSFLEGRHVYWCVLIASSVISLSFFYSFLLLARASHIENKKRRG